MISRIILFIAVCSFNPAIAQAGPTNETTPSQPAADDVAAIVKRAVFADRDSQEEALAAAIALGPAVQSEAEKYLKHADVSVRGRAFHVLIHIPELGQEYILFGLRSSDPALRSWAVYEAGPFLSTPEVADAWVQAFVNHLRQPMYGGPDPQALLSAPEPVRSTMAAKLIPQVVVVLDQTKSGKVADIIRMLGELGEPGDEQVIDAIVRTHKRHWDRLRVQTEESELPDALHRWRIFDQTTQVALVNLAALGALEAYERDIVEAEYAVRYHRLRGLRNLRPTPEVLHMTLRLLSNNGQGLGISTAHETSDGRPMRYNRICDAAMYALRCWFDDFPVKDAFSTIHADDRIAEAQLWLGQRILDPSSTPEVHAEGN